MVRDRAFRSDISSERKSARVKILLPLLQRFSGERAAAGRRRRGARISPPRDVIAGRKRWLDKTRLDNRIYQKRARSADVSPAGMRPGKYEGDQQIPDHHSPASARPGGRAFSRPGETVRGRSGKLSSAAGKNRGRSIILPSFPVAANLARAEWIKRSSVGSLAA